MTADDRIVSLESQVRTLKRVLYAACGIGLLALLLAANSMTSSADRLTARELLIRNKEGMIAVGIGVHASGTGMISIFNKHGMPVAALQVAEEDGTGRLEIRDEEGKIVVGIGAGAKGNGGIMVRNNQGTTVAALSCNTDGDGSVSILNKTGKPIGGIATTPAGDGGLILADKDGKTVLTLPQ